MSQFVLTFQYNIKASSISNLFSLEPVNFGATEIVSVPVDFSKRGRVFGDCRRHDRTRRDCRLVVCLINTVDGGRALWLECWHVWPGSGENGLCWGYGWRTRWRCGTHFTFSLIYFISNDEIRSTYFLKKSHLIVGVLRWNCCKRNSAQEKI